MLEQQVPEDHGRSRGRRSAGGVGRWIVWVGGSIALHMVLVAALAAALPVPQRLSRPIPVEVTFVKGAPAARPPAPPAGPPSPAPPHPIAVRHRVRAPVHVAVTIAREVPPSPVPTTAREPDAPAAPEEDPVAARGGIVGGVAEGIAGGMPGGVAGGDPQGIAGGALPVDGPTAAFDPSSMTRPVYVSGPSPQYTRKAIDREVEGDMVVRCIVKTDGAVRGCEVMAGLPYLDDAVVDALQGRRYRPAMRDGAPVEVKYVFRLHMKMPR